MILLWLWYTPTKSHIILRVILLHPELQNHIFVKFHHCSSQYSQYQILMRKITNNKNQRRGYFLLWLSWLSIFKQKRKKRQPGRPFSWRRNRPRTSPSFSSLKLWLPILLGPLLMVQKSGDHQLRLVVRSSHYLRQVLAPSQVVFSPDFWTINSLVSPMHPGRILSQPRPFLWFLAVKPGNPRFRWVRNPNKDEEIWPDWPDVCLEDTKITNKKKTPDFLGGISWLSRRFQPNARAWCWIFSLVLQKVVFWHSPNNSMQMRGLNTLAWQFGLPNHWFAWQEQC